MINQIQHWLEKRVKKIDKNYLHFDNKPDLSKEITIDGLSGKKYKNPQDFFEVFFDVDNIKIRGFWPLIHFTKIEKKYKKSKYKNKKGHFEYKPREIYYGSHYDSFIYSYYAFLIGEEYDFLLKDKGLDNNILAYRHIDMDTSSSGKNNIYFARDAFDAIFHQKNSLVFSFDISKFFIKRTVSYFHLIFQNFSILSIELFGIKIYVITFVVNH